MRAKEFITELGNQPYQMPKRWGGGVKYGIATKSFILPDSRELFIEIQSESGIAVINFYVGDRQQITNKGDAFKIFSTVANEIGDYTKKYKPKFIAFTSAKYEPSRIKLYDRLVSNITNSGILSSSYTNITDQKKYWPKDLRWVLDDLMDIRGQKIYVLARTGK
jgi:hypothetical protein